MNKILVLVVSMLSVHYASASLWGSSSDSKDKVLLEKLTAITLTEGKKTNGRRSSPVPQLDCAGGTAGCYKHRPKVVQCRNVGFDGYDVQWECTADLDHSVRFGQIEVSCEGYDHPDDPYVLRGSCGLKYQLDWTSDGHRERRNYDYDDGYRGDGHFYKGSSSSGSLWIGSIIQLAVIGLIIYCVLGACFGSRRHASASASSSSSYGSTGSYDSHHYGSSAGTGSGPGFWSGAATGGMLGYMFGSRNTGRHYGGGYRSGWGSSGWGSGYNTSGWSSSGGGGWSSSSSSSSRGSRSTSGFGGTTRR